MQTKAMAVGAALAALIAAPVLAGETVEERETIEKRSMKIETVPAAPPTTIVEKRIIEVPPPVREKSVETYEKKE
jgi:hypothetical protein